MIRTYFFIISRQSGRNILTASVALLVLTLQSLAQLWFGWPGSEGDSTVVSCAPPRCSLVSPSDLIAVCGTNRARSEDSVYTSHSHFSISKEMCRVLRCSLSCDMSRRTQNLPPNHGKSYLQCDCKLDFTLISSLV
jgi:hypothetical protein